uniref:LETM1 domain-containing protein n=1 Tax=Angiostrongylus cantonensis TaxID=6313 RepID=A0A0K0DH05_ANGCA
MIKNQKHAYLNDKLWKVDRTRGLHLNDNRFGRELAMRLLRFHLGGLSVPEDRRLLWLLNYWLSNANVKMLCEPIVFLGDVVKKGIFPICD